MLVAVVCGFGCRDRTIFIYGCHCCQGCKTVPVAAAAVPHAGNSISMCACIRLCQEQKLNRMNRMQCKAEAKSPAGMVRLSRASGGVGRSFISTSRAFALSHRLAFTVLALRDFHHGSGAQSSEGHPSS